VYYGIDISRTKLCSNTRLLGRTNGLYCQKDLWIIYIQTNILFPETAKAALQNAKSLLRLIIRLRLKIPISSFSIFSVQVRRKEKQKHTQ
jgi:hypothetical protein